MRAFLFGAADVEPGVSSGVTDEWGLRDIDVAARWKSISIQIVWSQTGALIANWSGPAQPNIDILIPELSFLYFHVRPSRDSELIDAADLRAKVSSVRSSGLGDRYLGGVGFGANYDAALPAPIHPDAGLVSVKIFWRDDFVANAVLRASAMTTSPGPEIPLTLRHIDVLVTNLGGEPIAGAEVRATSTDSVDARLTRSKTDPLGACKLSVSDGAVALCVGAKGYRSVTTQPSASGGPTNIRLAPWTDGDFLVVEVVNESAEPVSEALVTVFPRTAVAGLGLGAKQQSRTNSRGRVELPRSGDGHMLVCAYHDDYGSTPYVPFESVPGTKLRLQLENVCTIEVVLHHRGAELPPHSGNEFWAVFDVAKERTWNGFFSNGIRDVDQIPLGRHVVSVYLPEQGLFGMGTILCESAGRYAVVLDLAEATIANGRVTAPVGTTARGFEVLARPTSIPNAVSSVWCRGGVNDDGSFKVMCGLDNRARFIVLAGETELMKTEALDVLSALTLRVP